MKQGTEPRKASRSTRKPTNAATADIRMRWERFVQEYLADPERNASAAYVRAGFTATGAAARTAAARLLKHPEIQAAIAAVRERDAKKYDVSRERVLAELAKIAFHDPRRFYRDDGSLKLPMEMDEDSAAALQGFEQEEEYDTVPVEEEQEPQGHGGALKRKRKKGPRLAVGRTTKIKWSDKRAALESIIKLQGYDKQDDAPGTAGNPLHMIVQDLQGRRSALLPTVDVEDDEDDG